jgi:DnaA-like protein
MMHNTELLRQNEAHKAAKARLWHSKPKAKPQPVLEPVYIPYRAHQIPLWERHETVFNAHILDFRNWQADQYERRTAKGYIISRCEDFGIKYPIMVGPSRHGPIAKLRQILYFEVHEKFGRSFPQIGRLFGGRDHTTALSGYRKIKAMTSEERQLFIQAALKDIALGK